MAADKLLDAVLQSTDQVVDILFDRLEDAVIRAHEASRALIVSTDARVKLEAQVAELEQRLAAVTADRDELRAVRRKLLADKFEQRTGKTRAVPGASNGGQATPEPASPGATVAPTHSGAALDAILAAPVAPSPAPATTDPERFVVRESPNYIGGRVRRFMNEALAVAYAGRCNDDPSQFETGSESIDVVNGYRWAVIDTRPGGGS